MAHVNRRNLGETVDSMNLAYTMALENLTKSWTKGRLRPDAFTIKVIDHHEYRHGSTTILISEVVRSEDDKIRQTHIIEFDAVEKEWVYDVYDHFERKTFDHNTN